MAEQNSQKFVACLIGPCQDVEDAFQDLLTKRTIDEAEGAQLRALGKLVGFEDDGITDDELFRRYVRAQIATNKSDGLTEDLITVASLIVHEDGAVYIVRNAGVASVAVQIAGIDASELTPTLLRFLKRAVAAGVRLILETWVDEDEDNIFTCDDVVSPLSVGGGFGDSVAGAVGGMLISAME